MSKTRIIILIIFSGLGIFIVVNSINEIKVAEQELKKAEQEEKTAKQELKTAQQELELVSRDLAYEYGRCVFYDKFSVEQCNAATENKGLPLYEKYYGDGSWTVDADPVP